MDIAPILATLRRHKTILLLLVLEIAVSCAIVCNGLYMVVERLQHMDVPSGLAEHQLVQIQQAPIQRQPNRYARAQADLAALRQIPGVQAVGMTNMLPFGSNSSNSNVLLAPTQPHPTLSAASYFGQNLVATFGLRLVAGRGFRSDEYVNADVALKSLADGSGKGFPAPVIITRALAERLWPGSSALGKMFWLTPTANFRVIGVVATLVRARPVDPAAAQYSMIIPLRMGAGASQSYVLRTRPQDRQRVLRAGVAALKRVDAQRVITHARTFDEIRDRYFQDDRAMAGMLVGAIAAILLVTGLGIVGLASFWVGQRRRQIGIRRALGATRRNILRYFQAENFLIVTFGIVLGMVLAYGLNLLLMQRYELPRLPLWYLPVGALTLWLLGQIAVLGPALRAASVSPVEATRT